MYLIDDVYDAILLQSDLDIIFQFCQVNHAFYTQKNYLYQQIYCRFY
ncbi:MAG TPA: hypothetical protein VLG50_07825 [Candidatus Saccharimonadales bacterium]|nr:hypothetical protein [Candidatus Saccharimonadales bacterium]